jgi:hypothetical protein
MVRFCVAALLVVLAWLTPGSALAASRPPLLAQTPAAAVTATDIPTFAKAYQAVQTLRMKAENDMVKAVETEGLSIDRFNAIAETQIDGAAESPDDMAKIAQRAKFSKQENKQFKTAVDHIIAIRQATENEMELAIEAEGLSIDAFNTLLEQAADDTDLQRQISDAIVKQTLTKPEPES